MNIDKKTKLCYAIIFSLLFALTPSAKSGEIKEYLKPDKTNISTSSFLSLNGDWLFRFSPQDKWEKILVPGEAAMQGFAIEHDKPYLYKKEFTVPKEYKQGKTILRFDGVYSYAKLFVNGKFVRNHVGGFTRWEADITDYLLFGKKNTIEVEVTDRIDDVSYGSGYAHHPIGGILRDVTLYVIDKDLAIENLAIETELDSIYKNAKLRINYNINSSKDGKLIAKLKLEGKTIVEKEFSLKDANRLSHEIDVTNPLKWDAEHPNLYTLEMSLIKNNAEVATYTKNVGFRKIEIVNDKMYVNGKAIKLRGSCRHDIHPTLGRTTDAYIDSMDVVLLKRSNQNFVRTSHYPPTERFIEFCDKMGIYVECETAICFINTYAQKNYSQVRRDMHYSPQYTDAILGQLKEMVATHRSHASVLFWSIGNESIWGENLQLSYDWVKTEDKTRPVIFSYPGTVPADKKCYDIISLHYQNVKGNVNQFGISSYGYQVQGYPALFDEWAHVPCYTYSTLREDPNIREFWGQTLDMMWNGTFNAPGGLGGAIWGYIDETFMLPPPKKGTPYWIEFAHTAKPEPYKGDCVGYGEWGIIDVWRREKPEFWGTKKAYSPIRLETEKINDFAPSMPIKLKVYNRFDHTRLDEVTIKYIYQGESFTGVSTPIEPHSKGTITVPAKDWKAGELLTVEFTDKNGELIDGYNVEIGSKERLALSTATDNSLKIEENSTHFIVKGKNFDIPFSKVNGLIENAAIDGNIVIKKGPYLHIDVNYNHLTGAEVRSKAHNFVTEEKNWSKKNFTISKENNIVKGYLTGNYNDIDVSIIFTIYGNGRIETFYQTENEPNGYLREVGLKFNLPQTFESITWERDGYWSYYPETHFAANKGTAPLYNKNIVEYGEEPKQNWEMDTHNYYYFANAGASTKKPLTQWAKGMKENIYTYTLNAKKSNVTIESQNASLACRLNKQNDEELTLYINNRWDYPEIAWGDYCKAEALQPVHGIISFKLSK